MTIETEDHRPIPILDVDPDHAPDDERDPDDDQDDDDDRDDEDEDEGEDEDLIGDGL
jgi:hypothetical protein